MKAEDTWCYLSKSFCVKFELGYGKEFHAVQETRVPFLGREDPLEAERATHSSILAWEISWPEEPGMGLERVGHDLVIKQQQQNLSYLSSSTGWLFSLMKRTEIT